MAPHPQHTGVTGLLVPTLTHLPSAGCGSLC